MRSLAPVVFLFACGSKTESKNAEPAAKPADPPPAAKPPATGANVQTFKDLGVSVELPPNVFAKQETLGKETILKIHFKDFDVPTWSSENKDAVQEQGLICSRATDADSTKPPPRDKALAYADTADGWGLVSSTKYKHNSADFTIECFRKVANLRCIGSLLGDVGVDDSDPKAEAAAFEKQTQDAKRILAVCDKIRSLY
jgi:hypothetical protein